MAAGSSLRKIFCLEQVRESNYKINSMWSSHNARVAFGGHVVGLSVQACNETIPKEQKLNVHSIHSCFLRGGIRSTPTYFTIKNTREGKNFVVRSVTVAQNEKEIFTMLASYHNESKEKSHVLNFKPKMPKVRHHSKLENLRDIMDAMIPSGYKPNPIFDRPSYVKEFLDEFPSVQLKPSDPEKYIIPCDRKTNTLDCWVKVTENMGESQNEHRAVLAFLSDLTAAYTPASNQPHFDIAVGTSLNHSIWFHRNVNINDWLFYQTVCPTMSLCRAFVTGNFWNESGDLIATVMQENLYRPKL